MSAFEALEGPLGELSESDATVLGTLLIDVGRKRFEEGERRIGDMLFAFGSLLLDRASELRSQESGLRDAIGFGGVGEQVDGESLEALLRRWSEDVPGDGYDGG